MKANLLIAGSSKETGALLSEYLINRGVELTRSAKRVISYGVHCEGALNGCCARGKIFNMRTMKENGVRTVPFFMPGDNIPAGAYPLFARKNHGYGGKDLMPCFQPEEVKWRLESGWAWFSSIIPMQDEFRVWVFRNEILDVYRKEQVRKGEFLTMGRNFGNGFDFRLFNKMPLRTFQPCVDAVRCLGLDFAAVDCLLGKDGLLYVLETNTAPGVIKSGAQVTLGKLADRMVGWLREARA